MPKFHLSKKVNSFKHSMVFYSNIRIPIIKNESLEKIGIKQCGKCDKLFPIDFFSCPNCNYGNK